MHCVIILLFCCTYLKTIRIYVIYHVFSFSFSLISKKPHTIKVCRGEEEMNKKNILILFYSFLLSFIFFGECIRDVHFWPKTKMKTSQMKEFSFLGKINLYCGLLNVYIEHLSILHSPYSRTNKKSPNDERRYTFLCYW